MGCFPYKPAKTQKVGSVPDAGAMEQVLAASNREGEEAGWRAGGLATRRRAVLFGKSKRGNQPFWVGLLKEDKSKKERTAYLQIQQAGFIMHDCMTYLCYSFLRFARMCRARNYPEVWLHFIHSFIRRNVYNHKLF